MSVTLGSLQYYSTAALHETKLAKATTEELKVGKTAATQPIYAYASLQEMFTGFSSSISMSSSSSLSSFSSSVTLSFLNSEGPDRINDCK